LGQYLAGANGQQAGSSTGSQEDVLGDFIAKNQDSWDRRAITADMNSALLGAFGGTGAANRGQDVLLAAGAGYDGGIGQGIAGPIVNGKSANTGAGTLDDPRAITGASNTVRSSDSNDVPDWLINNAGNGLKIPGGAFFDEFGSSRDSINSGSQSAAVADADPFGLVAHDYQVEPGPVSRYYQGQVGLFSDSNQPWYVRTMSFVNATLASPVMLLEEGGRGIMNVPYAGSQIGQHAAIFNQATDVDTKVIAGLNMVKFGSEGFVNAYAGGILGRQVYVQAQDEAVSYWLKQQVNGDIRKFNEVYTSAVDGTRRLGYSFGGVSGYRAHNTEVMATRAGEYMSLERPISPADAIERNALSPLWGNNATELYQVTIRSGVYFKGQVAPQSGWYQGAPFSLGGGNTQVFMPAKPNPAGGYPIAPWAPGQSKKVPYGG